MTKVIKQIAPAFENFIFDWDYDQYLLVGGYGSGKSYQVATKIVLKLLEEKRKCLVVRNVYSTIHESCYSLIKQIITSIGLMGDEIDPTTPERLLGNKKKNIVTAYKSPLSFIFPNGSKIIFRGMDSAIKLKSIFDVSLIWVEEASEINYDGYKELLGRMRSPGMKDHILLSCNPVGRNNWVYQHFFLNTDNEGHEKVILDENKFYSKKELIVNGTYYHHSTPEDNPWLPIAYIKKLEEIRKYDYPLYTIARLGRFGASGIRVLPQIVKPVLANEFKRAIHELGDENHYFGLDFGFEESYNAVICCAVDMKRKYLYIYDEVYINRLTDDKFATLPKMIELRNRIDKMNHQKYNKTIVADNEDPKAIQYLRQCGYAIRGCKNKFAGSRLSNTRKIKRFHKIIISPKCFNTWRELKDLTYKKDAKGNVIYDQFNIDPHTFSALWYALDSVNVADQKEKIYNSRGDFNGMKLNGAYGRIKQNHTVSERQEQLHSSTNW